MAKPTRTEVNCETGDTTVIELTASEIAEMDQLRAEAEANKAIRDAEAEARAIAKASAEAKLAALGLTTEEITALTK